MQPRHRVQEALVCGIGNYLARLEHRQHVARRKSVCGATIDYHNLVLTYHGHAVGYRHDAALGLDFRRAGNEIQRHVDATGEQFVSFLGFASRFSHEERDRVAAAGDVTSAGEDAVVDHNAVVVRIPQRVADPDNVVMSAELDGTLESA